MMLCRPFGGLDMSTRQKPRDPHKTILVCKHTGREVGRIPATAANASDYVQTLASHYGELTVDYEDDPTGGLLAAIHGAGRTR
jgi:hypothetical protein